MIVEPRAPPTTIALAVAIVVLGSFLCAEFGRYLPLARLVGLDTMLCLLVPSLLISHSWIAPVVVTSMRVAFSYVDILGWIICILVLGGVTLIDRHVLSRLIVKLGAPVIGGSVVALFVAWGIAALWSMDVSGAMFLQVVPMMAGGLTAGALPLSTGYASQWGQEPGTLLGQMLPSLFVANLTAVMCAGVIGIFARTLLHEPEPSTSTQREPAHITDVYVAIGAVIILYSCGTAASRWLGLTAPLVVIVIAIAGALLDVFPRKLVRGMAVVQTLCTSYLLFPLLWLVGMLLVPWDQLTAGFAPPVLSMAVAVVVALSATAFLMSRWAGINAADGATVTLSRAAMGGTGAIAILSAADRMPLLPFALIVVRFGGMLTVAAALQLASLARP
jgi:Na+/citrate or Na+/malate symporter